VPLLALCIPLRVAAPLAVLVSITIAAVVVAQDWRHIHLRSVAWLVLATAAGVPLGLRLLIVCPEAWAKGCLGILILLFALYCLAGRLRFRLERDSQAWLLSCGFIAGILGGAYGMNGPPLVIYGSLRGWSAQHFRATLQAYFLPASMLVMGGYWAAGLWTPVVTHDYLFCLPAVVPAVLVGRSINRRLHGAAFTRYIHLALAGVGLTLLGEAIIRPH
jgi:hypothetical protein